MSTNYGAIERIAHEHIPKSIVVIASGDNYWVLGFSGQRLGEGVPTITNKDHVYCIAIIDARKQHTWNNVADITSRPIAVAE